jgi:hypothetical protein
MYTWRNNNTFLILTLTSNLSSYTNYTIIISRNAKDLAGNNLETDYSFWFRTKDIIPPHANAGLDKEVNEDEVVVLNASLSLDDNQIVNWTWSFIDQEEILLYGEVVEYIFTKPGFYAITLTVYDVSNNSASDIVNITVLDITPPVANAGSDKVVEKNIEIEFNASLSQDNVGIVNWSWSFVENGEEIILYGEVVKYIFVEYGSYVITLNVTDEASNWALDFVNITVKDLTPPVIKIISPVNGTITNQNVTLIYSVYDNVDTPENITTGPENGTVYSEEGSYELIITATDSSGNIAQTFITFTIDKKPPTTLDNAPLGWQTIKPITITLTANDTLSGVNRTYYKLWLVESVEPTSWSEGTTITLTEDGRWKVKYYSIDKAGNEESTTTKEVWLDTTPPNTIDNALTGWQTVKPVIINLTANDTLSGINKTYYKVWLIDDEPSEWQDGTIINLTEDGKWKIKYYSTDKAGNKEFPTAIELWLDATPPKVTITEESQRVTEKSFTLHWTTNAIDVQYYEVSIDGIEWTNVGLATTYEFTLSKGENTLYVRAADLAGNIGLSSYIIVTYKKPEPTPWLIPGYEAIYLLVIIGVCVILARRKLKVGG